MAFLHPCPPAIFVLTGCLLLHYSSLLREWHSPTPALQPFLYQLAVFCFITPAFSENGIPPPLPSSHFCTNWLSFASLLQPSQRMAFPHPCPPAIFVPAGCLLLHYSSLLREGHSPTPALQPFFVLTGCLLLNYFSLFREGHSPPLPSSHFLY